MAIYTVVFECGDGFVDDFTCEADSKEEAETECLLASSEARRIIRCVEAI